MIYLVVCLAHVVLCTSDISSFLGGKRALVVRDGGGPGVLKMVAKFFWLCGLFLFDPWPFGFSLAGICLAMISERLPCGGGSSTIGGISSCRLIRSCLPFVSWTKWAELLSAEQGRGLMNVVFGSVFSRFTLQLSSLCVITGDEEKLFGWETLSDMELGDSWAEFCKLKRIKE